MKKGERQFSVHGIVPPHILEAIAKASGLDDASREAARQTLAVTQSFRENRQGLSVALRTARRLAAAVAPHKNRLVYTCNGGQGLPGSLVRSEGQGPSGDQCADECYDGLGSTFDLFWQIFQRNSIDNNGMNLVGSVHFGKAYDNAFWNGSQMVFGDGDGVNFNRFTCAIDVMGHELTHGVTAHTANLDYQGQSGALNESISDVFGSMVKQFSLNQDAGAADWLIGAGLFTAKIHGVALRSMKAPGTAYNDPNIGKDPQPADMAHYVNTASDNGGVHINSGIPNHAFYLLAVALGGKSWDKAGKIWYATLLDHRLGHASDFQTFANLTCDNAGKLFGSVVMNAVIQAWKQVGIRVAYDPFAAVYAQGDPGSGIGGYDLKSPADRVFAFDYEHSGKTDYLALYRPGTGTMWILKNAGGAFSPVYNQGDPGKGIGGYDLKSSADQAFAFDYEHSGKLDYIALYRPGTGTMWILKNSGGTFTPVYNQGDPGKGIGGYDLKSSADRAFAFDYEHSGKLDYIALYRPGTGTMWILKNSGGTFTPVYNQGDPGKGIGGYDLKSPADQAFAFDYEHSGKRDYIALYRPGTGTMWILKNSGGTFTPVYNQGDPGNGIGGYDLKSSADRAFAFDYEHSGKLDYIALYRPGTGTMWILKNTGGSFAAVFSQGDPGNGIGGYDLKSPADRAYAFDYEHSGRLDYLGLYRPATGTMWILKHS